MMLSLIVPIYNVEKYIEDCLRSIIIQLPGNNVEVILVDDGSPDKSIDIVNNILSSLDPLIRLKFKLIRQSNNGLSGARNTGIKYATGEYFAFLDSDDVLSEKFFSKILKIIKMNEIDIIQFKAYRFTGKGEKKSFLKDICETGNYNLCEINRHLFNQSAWFSCFRVYHFSLFENFKFPEKVNYEDAYLIPYIYLNSRKIYILNEELYGYRINLNGITFNYSEKNIDDLRGAIFKMIDNLKYFDILSPSIVSLAQRYFSISFQSEGFFKFIKRFFDFRKKLYKNRKYFNISLLDNKGNVLFYYFGIVFIIIDSWLKKIGIKND